MDNLRCRRLAEGLVYPHLQCAGDVDAARDDLTAHADLTRHALTGQRHGVEARAAVDDRTIHRNLLAGLHDDRLAHLHRGGTDHRYLAVALHVGRVGADVHHLRDRFAALVLGIVLEELADLEEQHHEYRLGELRFGSRQETDAQRTNRGHTHQEILVERVSLLDAFLDGLHQHVVAY